MIYPGIRDERIDFYYQGGRILEYKNKNFSYSKDYHKYMNESYINTKNNYLVNRPKDLTLEEFYRDLKNGVEKRHRSKDDKSTERQFLMELYKSTYAINTSDTKVLDVEVRFNMGNKKKCDLVLYNNNLQKLMLVEAKLVSSPDIKSTTTPKVLEQMSHYEAWLREKEILKEQYSNYIQFVNMYFNTNFNANIKGVCKSVKLIIFKMDEEKELLETHKEKLIKELGINNLLFYSVEDVNKLNIDEIWECLDR